MQGHLSGFYHGQFLRRNSNGYPMGQVADPDNVAAGTTTHAYKLLGPVAATAPQTRYLSADFRGGMAPLGKVDLGVDTIDTFNLTLSALDTGFGTRINGSALNVTLATENELSAPNTFLASPLQGMLILTTAYQTAAGANRFMNWMYPNVTLRENGVGASQEGGTNPNPLTYTVTASAATRSPFGHPLSSLSLLLENDRDIVLRYITSHPMSVTTYVAAAGATSFILGYRPTSSDVAAVRNVFSRNGTTFAPTSLAATTGVVTIPAATLNDIYVAAYLTRFIGI